MAAALSVTTAGAQMLTRSLNIGVPQAGYLTGGSTDAYMLYVPRAMELTFSVTKTGSGGAGGQQAMHVFGQINFQGQEDRYQYMAQTSESVVIRVDKTSTSSLDPKVMLYNAMGVQLATDDDSGEGLNSLLSYTLSPGTYTIGVASAGTSTGQYEMQVLRGATVDNLDPKVSLRNASGVEIGSDDDSGGDNNARLMQSVQPGTYQLVVSAYGTTTGQYTISVSEQTAMIRGTMNVGESRGGTLTSGQRDAYQLTVGRSADLVIGASKAQSVPIGGSANRMQVQGSIRFSGQEDRYQYQVSTTQPTTIRADKAQNSSLDPKVTLYNAQGAQLGTDDDSGEGLNALLGSTLQPGSYIVGVASAGTSTGDYVLVVEPGSPNTLDPKVSLRNAAGVEVGSDDDSGGGNDALLSIHVDPGTYQIVVSAYGTTSGQYMLTVGEAVARPMGAIGLGQSRMGTIGTGGERQLYSLQVPAAANITIDLVKSGNTTLDPEVVLRVAGGADIATDDDGGGDRNSRLSRQVGPGSYEIVVMGHNGTTGAYELRVSSAAVALAPVAGQVPVPTPVPAPAPVAPAGGGQVVTFDQEDGGFGTRTDDNVERLVTMGKYSVRARNNNQEVWSLPLGRKTDGTYTVTAIKMEGPDDGGFGLCFRVHGRGDSPNMYVFEISGRGKYRFRVRNDARWHDLVDWTDSRAIAKGNYQKNTLSVEAAGSHFVLRVNDTIVGAADDSSFREAGFVGLTVGEGLHIMFDDLQVPQSTQSGGGGADGH